MMENMEHVLAAWPAYLVVVLVAWWAAWDYTARLGFSTKERVEFALVLGTSVTILLVGVALWSVGAP